MSKVKAKKKTVKQKKTTKKVKVKVEDIFFTKVVSGFKRIMESPFK